MKGWQIIIVVEIVGKEGVVNIIGKLSMKGWRNISVVEIVSVVVVDSVVVVVKLTW